MRGLGVTPTAPAARVPPCVEARSNLNLVLRQSVVDRVREAFEQHPAKLTMENREGGRCLLEETKCRFDGCLKLPTEAAPLALVPADMPR
jgi:hypothetical protein